jgi:hypothetical protein
MDEDQPNPLCITRSTLAAQRRAYMLRNMRAHAHTRRLKTEHPGLARAMDTDPENERLYTADSLGMVYVWDLSGCDWRNPDLIVPTATPSKAKAARGSSYGQRALGARDGEVKRLFGWQAHTSVRGLLRSHHPSYRAAGIVHGVTGSTMRGKQPNGPMSSDCVVCDWRAVLASHPFSRTRLSCCRYRRTAAILRVARV